MTTKFRFIGFSFLFFCYTAFAAGAKKPGWIDSGKDALYPNSLYFVGVGSGSGDAEAQSDALGAISRQISAEVVSQTASADSEVNGAGSSSFQKKTQVYTAKALRNVKFAARHVDDGRFFVLAVLKISDYIANTDRVLTELLGETQKAADGLDETAKGADNGAKIRAALKLRSLAKVLRALTDDYRGILTSHPTAEVAGATHQTTAQSVVALEKVARDVLNQITFTLATKGTGLEDLAEKTTSYLIEGGLQKVDDDKGLVQVMLTSDLKFRPSPHGSLVVAKGFYRLTMRDSKTGKTFFQKETTIEGGGGDERGAASNLADDAWTEFATDLAKFTE